MRSISETETEVSLNQTKREKPPRQVLHRIPENIIICHCCVRPRKIITECNLKYSTPMKDWYMNKTMLSYQENEDYGV